MRVSLFFLSNGNASEPKIHTESPRPRILNEETAVVKFLREHYGITVSKLTRLVGYVDLNYHVTARDVQSNLYIDEVPGEGFFLKISNSDDSKRPAFLSAVTAMMEHLRQKGLACQKTVRSISGHMITQISSPSCSSGRPVTYLASVRTFLPGQVLARTRLSPQMLYDLGAFTAHLTQSLQ
ncbi:aminoglycoside phosphotransferase domain-containing protein 1, partial [Elysia marginata]